MSDLPLGFGMALAQNEGAMQYFAALPEQKKQEIISHTHQLHSRDEMHAFVQSLNEQNVYF